MPRRRSNLEICWRLTSMPYLLPYSLMPRLFIYFLHFMLDVSLWLSFQHCPKTLWNLMVHLKLHFQQNWHRSLLDQDSQSPYLHLHTIFTSFSSSPSSISSSSSFISIKSSFTFFFFHISAQWNIFNVVRIQNCIIKRSSKFLKYLMFGTPLESAKERSNFSLAISICGFCHIIDFSIFSFNLTAAFS